MIPAAQDTRLSAIEAVRVDLIPRLLPAPTRGRGRPPILPAGMLVCILRQETSQRAIWRLLSAHGLWASPRIPISDDAVSRRIQRSGPDPMAALFGGVTALLGDAGPGDTRLAPFATEVIALDETTLDPMARTRADLTDLVAGDARLLPGKLSATFDIRRQLFRRIEIGDDFRENERVPARRMVADLPPGSLILTDLGYVSFAWYDELTDAGQVWIARLRRKTSYTVVHEHGARDGMRDALVWLGAHRADRAKHLVRLIEVRHGRTIRAYLTNVTDPTTLPMAEGVRLYARRWDIELAIKTLKRDLGLHILWSATWPVIQTQSWAVLLIAQIAFHLRVLIAVRAGVDLFDVSLVLLLKAVPRFAAHGEDPIATIAALGSAGGFIRPSRRIRDAVPDPGEALPPPPELIRVRTPRYAGRRCGPSRTDRRF